MFLKMDKNQKKMCFIEKKVKQYFLFKKKN